MHSGSRVKPKRIEAGEQQLTHLIHILFGELKIGEVDTELSSDARCFSETFVSYFAVDVQFLQEFLFVHLRYG